MNKDMENKWHYQDMFDEVHASEDLLGKVKNMKNERVSRKIGRVGRVAYIVVAIVLIVIVSSNAISYAATGSTWVEKVIMPAEKVIIPIGTQEVELDKHIDDNEIEYLEGDFIVNDEECVIIKCGDDLSEIDWGGEFETGINEDGNEFVKVIREGKQVIRCGYHQDVEIDGEKVYLVFKFTDVEREGDNVKLKIKSKKTDITEKINRQEDYCYMIEMGGLSYYCSAILTEEGSCYGMSIIHSDDFQFRDLPLYKPFPEEESGREVIVEEDRVYLITKNTVHYDDEGERIIEEQQKIDITDQVKDGDYYYCFDENGENYFGIVYKDKSGAYCTATSAVPFGD